MASGVSWDELVNKDLSSKASRWFEELPALKNVQIPWCLKATAPVREVTLQTFVDASQEVNGAASYTKHLYEDGTVSCCLVVSKSRVAPLQAVNIPRLELMAAVVGLKLSQALSSWHQERRVDLLAQQHGCNVLDLRADKEVQTIRGQSCGWNPGLDKSRTVEICSDKTESGWFADERS